MIVLFFFIQCRATIILLFYYTHMYKFKNKCFTESSFVKLLLIERKIIGGWEKLVSSYIKYMDEFVPRQVHINEVLLYIRQNFPIVITIVASHYRANEISNIICT